MERIAELIKHPEYLDRDTLYELRSTLALYPYYQTARLLMLAAIYITDRRVLFNMIEAGHYRLRTSTVTKVPAAAPQESTASRTATLIDNFLDSIPKEDEGQSRGKRKPTPADAAVDYVAYLLETEGDKAEETVPEMKGQNLIDTFINADKGRIVLNEGPLLTPQTEKTDESAAEPTDEEYFTETLARIYIKQGRYSKALEIIQRLSLQFPKKNAYFADQIRFLEKLIINSNKKI